MTENMIRKVFNAKRLTHEATGVAPHDETTRDTYTAPDDVFAACVYVMMSATRKTIATYCRTVIVSFQYLIGGETVVKTVQIQLYNNTIGATVYTSQPVTLWLKPGDEVRITTTDFSTDGSVDYQCYALVYEYR